MLQGDNVRGVSSWLVSIAALKAPVQTFHRFGSTYNKILNSVSHFKITPADDIVLRAGCLSHRIAELWVQRLAESGRAGTPRDNRQRALHVAF
jgi:hypothetical protein